MILQLINVRFSENHPRYSPFTILSLTVTFLLCQKASFVSSSQSSISRFSIYWNEYFPFIFTLRSLTFRLSMNKYSDTISVSTSVMSCDFQPNSCDSTWQRSRRICVHSRTALIPPSTQSVISPFSAYQIAARVLSSIEDSAMAKPFTCHRG